MAKSTERLPYRREVCDDWDAFETSWDFKRHPLIVGGTSVAAAFDAWERECDRRLNTLKANEEELNRIFINIYGLQNELTPEVADKDATVRSADKLKLDERLSRWSVDDIADCDTFPQIDALIIGRIRGNILFAQDYERHHAP